MADDERLDDETATALVSDLLDRQTEDRNLDYKAAMSFTSREVKGKLLKCFMAFANTRDGGYVLVGVAQRGGRFEPDGISDEQARTFDPTGIADFARNHCSVLPRVTPRVVAVDDVNVLLLRVAEFADEPIVCTRDLHGSDNKPILRKGHVYVRTDDARCVEIDSAETMRSFLDLAVQKRGEGLIEQIRRLVGNPAVTDASTTTTLDLYAHQVDSAEAKFRREQLVDPNTYWFCTVVPIDYEPDRIPTNARLAEIRLASEVALRGWNFPHTDRNQRPFEDGVESVTHALHHDEASRFHRSGFFTWRALLREDASPEYEGSISFVSSLWTLVEFFVFASRYVPMVADTGQFAVTVGLANLAGHDLLVDTDGFAETRSTAANRFEQQYYASVEEIRSGYRSYATDASRRFLELFGLDVTPRDVEYWQNRLLERRY